jgi:Biotin carboxylase, N-terminal domain
MSMFSSVLIANRGEIAVRIARTATRLGLRTIAVYSEADAGALHTRVCDEAVLIGPASPRESYLAVDKLVEAAAAAATPVFGQAVVPTLPLANSGKENATSIPDLSGIWPIPGCRRTVSGRLDWVAGDLISTKTLSELSGSAALGPALRAGPFLFFRNCYVSTDDARPQIWAAKL